jgi:hypothetical protein
MYLLAGIEFLCVQSEGRGHSLSVCRSYFLTEGLIGSAQVGFPNRTPLSAPHSPTTHSLITNALEGRHFAKCTGPVTIVHSSIRE